MANVKRLLTVVINQLWQRHICRYTIFGDRPVIGLTRNDFQPIADVFHGSRLILVPAVTITRHWYTLNNLNRHWLGARRYARCPTIAHGECQVTATVRWNLSPTSLLYEFLPLCLVNAESILYRFSVSLVSDFSPEYTRFPPELIQEFPQSSSWAQPEGLSVFGILFCVHPFFQKFLLKSSA